VEETLILSFLGLPNIFSVGGFSCSRVLKVFFSDYVLLSFSLLASNSRLLLVCRYFTRSSKLLRIVGLPVWIVILFVRTIYLICWPSSGSILGLLDLFLKLINKLSIGFNIMLDSSFTASGGSQEYAIIFSNLVEFMISCLLWCLGIPLDHLPCVVG